MSLHILWHSIWHFVIGYIFYYPLFMSSLWIVGAIYFYFKNEKAVQSHLIPKLREGERWEGISILIPCFNEGENAVETITYALNVAYPDFEVIAINDGSTDNTLEILVELARTNPKLKVVNLAENQGKALGLQAGHYWRKMTISSALMAMHCLIHTVSTGWSNTSFDILTSQL